MNHKNQQGFGLVEAILVLVVLVALAVLGWYVWTRNQTTVDPNAAAIYDGWLSYSDPVGKYSVKYPSNWSLKVIPQPDTMSATSRAELTSPQDVVLTLAASQPLGLGGGPCYPAATDKPFQLNNACDSIQDLSAEKLAAEVYVLNSADRSAISPVKANIFLVTRHYANAKGTEHQYTIGLRAGTPDDIAKAQQPMMGPVFFSTPYIERISPDGKEALPSLILSASGSNIDFLNSPDATVIKNVLRSLSF